MPLDTLAEALSEGQKAVFHGPVHRQKKIAMKLLLNMHIGDGMDDGFACALFYTPPRERTHRRHGFLCRN